MEKKNISTSSDKHNSGHDETTVPAGTKILHLIQSLLPGIFLLGLNIGTGSVTAMAKAGADYGMSLLWTLFLSCLVTYFLIVTYGKFTLVTGQTALHAFRKHIHPAVGIFFIVALTANVCGSVIGVMGIISEMCSVWSRTVSGGGIKSIYFAAFFIMLAYLLFLNGRMMFFEKAMAVIVTIMACSFLVNLFIAKPEPLEILKGMVPNIPSTPGNKPPFLVIASMVGTTIYSGLFIIRTTQIKEMGWTLKNLAEARRDAGISVFMMFVISGAIMAASAATLHTAGQRLQDVSQMILLLEPLAGKAAVAIFVLGIVAAGLSSHFPNIMFLPWLLCDYTRSQRDMTRTRFRIIVLVISLLGLYVPAFGVKPVPIMLLSQAFGATLLPVTVLCILYVGNKKSIMGQQTHGIGTNIILVCILGFAVYMSGLGIMSLIG